MMIAIKKISDMPKENKNIIKKINKLKNTLKEKSLINQANELQKKLEERNKQDLDNGNFNEDKFKENLDISTSLWFNVNMRTDSLGKSAGVILLGSVIEGLNIAYLTIPNNIEKAFPLTAQFIITIAALNVCGYSFLSKYKIEKNIKIAENYLNGSTSKLPIHMKNRKTIRTDSL